MTHTGEQPKYRLGVALSGGGARGFAHIGALRALDEAGLKPDIIAGVSAGSVAAVLYAAGLSFDAMLKLFEDSKLRDFCELKIKGGGLFRMDKFGRHIRKAVQPYTNLEDLPIKTILGATDLDHGCPAIFDHGSIVNTVMASCSIPIIFPPVSIDGVRYVDGGVLRNMPAWSIRDNCETLIGINCSPMPTGTARNSAFEIGMRCYHLMSRSNVAADLKLCDLGIEISEISAYKTFNLKEIQQVYIRGYAAVKRAVKKWKTDNGLSAGSDTAAAAPPLPANTENEE